MKEFDKARRLAQFDVSGLVLVKLHKYRQSSMVQRTSNKNWIENSLDPF